MRIFAIAALSLALVPGVARADRVKDLATVAGVRKNPLVGVGIVVGLTGTGDDASSPVTRRGLAQMMKRLGITIGAAEIKAKNVAAVAVTAELYPFARTGSRLDVTVSSMGSAKSLQGGTLLVTPLKGADGAIYALAQGGLSVGGYAASGQSGSSGHKNHTTVARVPSGAVIEREAPTELPTDEIVLQLNEPDFTTAARIADAIDRTFGTPLARVRDPGAVAVRLCPRWRRRPVHFVAALESVEAVPDAPARVIIDERTGTIVVGGHVTLGAAAIAHGGITVTIDERPEASQPGTLAEGDTVVTPRSEVAVSEEHGQLTVIGPAATLADVSAALNALGVKPRDLVSILQALDAAGALRADVQML